MGDIWATIRSMGWNLTHRLGIIEILDILIVAIIIYELLLLTRHTRGSALLKGLFLLLVIVAISNILGLTSLNWLLTAVLQYGALVLVILFQPELRKMLERMGRSRPGTGNRLFLSSQQGKPEMGIPRAGSVQTIKRADGEN